MNISELIIPFALIIVVFAISLYIRKAKPGYQLLIAGVAVSYSVVAYFVTGERSMLFIAILGVSWIAKLYSPSKKLQ